MSCEYSIGSLGEREKENLRELRMQISSTWNCCAFWKRLGYIRERMITGNKSHRNMNSEKRQRELKKTNFLFFSEAAGEQRQLRVCCCLATTPPETSGRFALSAKRKIPLADRYVWWFWHCFRFVGREGGKMNAERRQSRDWSDDVSIITSDEESADDIKRDVVCARLFNVYY